jgi:hypothetical protein
MQGCQSEETIQESPQATPEESYWQIQKKPLGSMKTPCKKKTSNPSEALQTSFVEAL